MRPTTKDIDIQQPGPGALPHPATLAGVLEGTEPSKGRGTASPFEFAGAPFGDAGWAAAVREMQAIPGLEDSPDDMVASRNPNLDVWRRAGAPYRVHPR